MGRKLDLSGLTDDETEHVLQVVQRDFNLRKKEEERLSEMKQKLDEEGSKCSILSKHQKFVEHCCMRCCSPFTFLINSKRRCGDCKFNVCKSCCSFQKQDKVWICCVCQQARLLRTQSLEWFYNNVKSRFKRFGSAKVLKNLYRKHRLETGACFDILGGSFFEANLENEGSLSGSDSTFYRQSEGHSMMDTLAVALRVAEEAIEEAICKAEACGDSLDKQNEASYLRDHKEELTEELATTILQKIIRKQKNKSEKQAEEEPEWSQPQGRGVKAAQEGTATSPTGRQAAPDLWRSHSACPINGEDTLKTAAQEAGWRQLWDEDLHPREDSALPSWGSTDRLDKTNLAPVLQSPDGNWMALKEGALPPTRLLTKPKSGTFEALEAASSVVSAYEEMGSDSEEDFDWSEALSKLCPRPRGLLADPQPQPAQARGPSAASTFSSLSPNPEAACSDSETSSAGSSREAGRRARLSWRQRKPPRSPPAEKMRLQGELDVNFNPQMASGETSDSSEPEEGPPTADRRARRWRRARVGSEEPSKEASSPSAHPQDVALHQVWGDSSETDISNEAQHPGTSTHTTEEKLRNRLYELAMKMSEKETSSGEDQEFEPKTESETQKESLSSEDNSQCVQDELKKKYSAVSLCNISTEVLKVINATEELIAESTGPWELPPVPLDRAKGTFPLGTDQVRLDEQLTSLEENVYLAAGTVYGLEGQLTELEDAARCIHSGTNETELANLEDQVATAAAQVHHAELQISDIESRIAALTVAGLNIAPCVHLTRKRSQKQRSQVQTIDTSRQQRRKLPAPPVKAEKNESSSVTALKTFNHNFILQGSSAHRTNERTGTPRDSMECKAPAIVYLATSQDCICNEQLWKVREPRGRGDQRVREPRPTAAGPPSAAAIAIPTSRRAPPPARPPVTPSRHVSGRSRNRAQRLPGIVVPEVQPTPGFFGCLSPPENYKSQDSKRGADYPQRRLFARVVSSFIATAASSCLLPASAAADAPVGSQARDEASRLIRFPFSRQ
ncbi:PREDICTED: rab effector MyRIP-like [Elephantulus edwardii]|uniref:rab effector MyRIP-like n=1 Tax=Elephantulus edwardii TaxID=28737 RepID=UPI0003F07A1F|nr:PREDICTED: rab effector MyRIP-like [Elephantulus edwardii]